MLFCIGVICKCEGSFEAHEAVHHMNLQIMTQTRITSAGFSILQKPHMNLRITHSFLHNTLQQDTVGQPYSGL